MEKINYYISYWAYTICLVYSPLTTSCPLMLSATLCLFALLRFHQWITAVAAVVLVP